MYGTSKSTGPWYLPIRLDREPRCPGCAEFLQPCVVEIRDGWAWCQICVEMRLHCEPWMAAVLESESMRECSCVVYGLRFYVPDPMNGQARAAYEWAEASGRDLDLSVVDDEPEGLYLRTPAGVQSYADRPVINDATWNAQCLAGRKRFAQAMANDVANAETE